MQNSQKVVFMKHVVYNNPLFFSTTEPNP